MILITNTKILAMDVIDNQEPMLDLKNQNTIVYGPSPEIPNNTDYTLIRKTVYEKIKQAQNLLPKGLRFCLYEGYIPITPQDANFNNPSYNELGAILKRKILTIL